MCGGFDFSDLDAVVLVCVWVWVWLRGVCLSVVVLRLRNWCECWVVFGWMVLSVIVFLDWRLVGVGNFIGFVGGCLLIDLVLCGLADNSVVLALLYGLFKGDFNA